jgi:hypothetical protein
LFKGLSVDDRLLPTTKLTSALNVFKEATIAISLILPRPLLVFILSFDTA